ncbi:MAG TPA: helix-turn-helix transcriptional regulator, partial [Chitinophagales bacterium]|nr:helix-turn-helix transcriptional regulator [Chitinophagales bacterium]
KDKVRAQPENVNAGLLTYEWKESTSGPPRKYFTLTLEGTTAFEDLKQTWNELSDAADAATNYHKSENNSI